MDFVDSACLFKRMQMKCPVLIILARGRGLNSIFIFIYLTAYAEILMQVPEKKKKILYLECDC